MQISYDRFCSVGIFGISLKLTLLHLQGSVYKELVVLLLQLFRTENPKRIAKCSPNDLVSSFACGRACWPRVGHNALNNCSRRTPARVRRHAATASEPPAAPGASPPSSTGRVVSTPPWKAARPAAMRPTYSTQTTSAQ